MGQPTASDVHPDTSDPIDPSTGPRDSADTLTENQALQEAAADAQVKAGIKIVSGP